MSLKEKVKKLKDNKIIKSICNFLNKDNYIIPKVIIVLILSVVGSIIFEHTIYRRIDPQYISNNRMMLVAGIFAFIGIHFVFRLDKMYKFIHKYRYAIAAVLLIFAMIMGYHGSSIINFHGEIQKNSQNRRFNTLLGVPRLIRTDEWASSMLYKLSQCVGENSYEQFNDRLRGTTTDMFTLVDAPSKTILMIGKPLQLGFLLFGANAGISFYWYGKLVFMFLGAYELCRIITKDRKKVSLVGAIMITFSAAVQWWYCMDTLIWGQLILVLVNKFMKTDKKWVKYLCAIGLVSVLLSYAFVLYPAWQVPFVYVMLAVFIYMFVTNLKEGYKFTVHDVIVIILTIAAVAGLLVMWFMTSNDAITATMNTDYPGARREVGGGAFILYSYVYNIFFPYDDAFNPCETSSMLSLFPIPMLMACIYLIRNIKTKKKCDIEEVKEYRSDLLFLIPTLIVAVFFSIWCIKGFPETLAKITFMSMSTSHRASIALGTINIYILIYLLGRMERNAEKQKETKIMNKWLGIIVGAIITGIILVTAREHLVMFIPQLDLYIGNVKMTISAILFGITFICTVNMHKKGFRNVLYVMLIAIALITGLAVNPVSRTTDIIYEKPICAMFEKIRNEDPDAIWLGDDTGWYLNNYMVANGLRVINSTNVYPNFDLFEKVLGKEEAALPENRTVYNRYCHVNINLGIYEKNRIFAAAADNIVVELNAESLDDLGIDYIVAKKDINEMGYSIEFEELYYEDGLYIFKPIYENN